MTILIASLFFNLSWAQPQQNMEPMPSDAAFANLIEQGQRIDSEPIRRTATSQNGRIKPLDTLARETILFLTGSYGRFGTSRAPLTSTQLYFALPTAKGGPWAPIVEIRDIDLRTRLGYLRDKKYFSLAELESSSLGELAQPLFKKQEEGGHLTSDEKKITEAFSQMGVLQQLISGDHWIHSVDFSFLFNNHGGAESEMANTAKEYLGALVQDPASARALALTVVEKSRAQKAPDLFAHYLQKLDLEVFYNDARLFFWAAMIALLSGLLLTLDITRKKLSHGLVFVLYGLVLLPLTGGIGLRVYITEFAPVTNMFGTMLWVSQGVTVFSLILFALYRNAVVSGFLMIASGLILLLTEQIPLILSPDLDPLVAVLRSNFWLSTHVTTITISYAAFTIAMILGNVALFKIWLPGQHLEFMRQFSHYAYRMIQLGCFLLSVGIILGGIWADYSWGRFWGWDPKETWALIADMGFLTLLHARLVGWVTPFLLLALAPIAYLLVIMAWYGVNFILATGLHSYGFSSGGAMMVAIFVSVQVIFIVATLVKGRGQFGRLLQS